MVHLGHDRVFKVPHLASASISDFTEHLCYIENNSFCAIKIVFVSDRSGVNKFVKEFEESKEKLDGYCSKLSRCINDKRVLIDMLHHSETYYEAAYEEAKVIVHVS